MLRKHDYFRTHRTITRARRRRYKDRRASEQPSRVLLSSSDSRRAVSPCANRLNFGRRDSPTPRIIATSKFATTTETTRVDGVPRRSTARAETTRDRYVQPTLRQAWPREYPRPQYAFKISMFNVSCNSHYFTQLAALFIDTRAE